MVPLVSRLPSLSLTWFATMLASLSALGQPSNPGWHLQDPEKNLLQGISADRAYQKLEGKPSTPVVVAVIDSVIDIDHEDLKSVLWTNVREVAGNGVDDDRNGYVDDIHGWNFIGGKSGEVNEDSYELTREFVRLDKQFADIPENKVPGKKRKEYERYLKVKDKFTRLRDENQEEYAYYLKLSRNLDLSLDTLRATLKTDKITSEVIDTFQSTNPTLSFAKGFARLVTNTVYVVQDNMWMPQLARYRRLWIYLPNDYYTSNNYYRTVYMMDGKMFLMQPPRLPVKYVDDSLKVAQLAGDSGAILVAIDNGGQYRLDEYCPFINTQLAEGKAIGLPTF